VVRASAAFDGRSGVQGIAIDPVNGRALFSTVGRLPQVLAQSRTPGSDEMAATNTVTQISPGFPNRTPKTRSVNTLWTPAGLTRCSVAMVPGSGTSRRGWGGSTG